jgi:hypothetical protein
MTTPTILEEIRRVRHEMSSAIDHDPNRIVDYFASIQKRNANRVVNLADQGPKGRTKDCTEADGEPQSDGNSVSSAR